MPTYTYRCHQCGYLFEVWQKITDGPISTCPKCGGSVKKIITEGPGFILKGSGFYATDYRNPKKPEGECCGKANPCDHPKRCCGE